MAGDLHDPAQVRMGRGRPHLWPSPFRGPPSWPATMRPGAMCVRGTAAHTSWPSAVARHKVRELQDPAHKCVAWRHILVAVRCRSAYGRRPPRPCVSACGARRLILLAVRCRSAYGRRRKDPVHRCGARWPILLAVGCRSAHLHGLRREDPARCACGAQQPMLLTVRCHSVYGWQSPRP